MKSFSIELPLSVSPIGKWLELNGGEISITCSLGVFCVQVAWKVLHSYSDEKGEHSTNWSLTRYNKDLAKALKEATESASDIMTTKSANS